MNRQGSCVTLWNSLEQRIPPLTSLLNLIHDLKFHKVSGLLITTTTIWTSELTQYYMGEYDIVLTHPSSVGGLTRKGLTQNLMLETTVVINKVSTS